MDNYVCDVVLTQVPQSTLASGLSTGRGGKAGDNVEREGAYLYPPCVDSYPQLWVRLWLLKSRSLQTKGSKLSTAVELHVCNSCRALDNSSRKLPTGCAQLSAWAVDKGAVPVLSYSAPSSIDAPGHELHVCKLLTMWVSLWIRACRSVESGAQSPGAAGGKAPGRKKDPRRRPAGVRENGWNQKLGVQKMLKATRTSATAARPPNWTRERRGPLGA